MLSVQYEALDSFNFLVSEVFTVHGLISLKQLNSVGILLISSDTNTSFGRFIGLLTVAIAADGTIASDALL